MANEYGGSEQERMDNGNAVPAARQQGTDVNLNYDILPVPHSEVGSVDSAGSSLRCVGWRCLSELLVYSVSQGIICTPGRFGCDKRCLCPCAQRHTCLFTAVPRAGSEVFL